ncbi:hypothetical protein [Clostridium tertium]|uniref:hypothetical protein n=1 Tax=Clostridium tertium TaxID=1559 RepID=UPI0023B2C6B6|nr:hypothetical protein [Clostridium tertium]
MKKTFVIEINYEELEENVVGKTEVLQETSIEVALDNMMEGYVDSKSIKGKYYTVEAREIID